MFSRNARGERRVSPRVHRFLMAAHITVSVAWLGVVVAKITLQIAAMAGNVPDVANALNVSFPPLAIGTAVSGALLSLGTKWGLLRYYWVVTKMVLTVGVIATAISVGDRLAAAGGRGAGSLRDIAIAPTPLLLALSVAHLLMLLVATVISVYKPWGTTWFGRRAARGPLPRGGATLTGSRAGS